MSFNNASSHVARRDAENYIRSFIETQLRSAGCLERKTAKRYILKCMNVTVNIKQCNTMMYFQTILL